MEFRNTACWTASDAAAMLRTEALESSRAVFMAVHSPIRDFDVEGVLAGSVLERTEDSLLRVLAGPDHRHLFCVVEGEPGSGKSHLIRWLHFRWSNLRKDDLVLMVPRSNGSLEGALRVMKERLPEQYRGLFAGLGQVHDTSLRGRARDFHSKLANSLSPDYFATDAPLHADWAAKHHISHLIGHPQVLGQWPAPLRILETLSGGSNRNSRTDFLSLFDIADLVQRLRPLHDQGLGPYALMAKRTFQREAEKLQLVHEQGLEGEAFMRQAATVAPELVRLLEALEARFNTVVQDLVGIGRDGLVRAFRQLRRELARDGRRLVLLLEDITSFQGVDNQLLDVLVARSETEEGSELCDLLSVVGITTDFFNRAMRSYGNLRERIALHLRLGDASGGRVEESRSLASSAGRQAFVGTYLRAIRAGVAAVEEWAEVGQGAVPNTCEGCRHRSACHAAFGATEQGVGLFPLSPVAIDRIFGALSDPEGTMGLRTPRGMVQNVLSPLLQYPERLVGGQFPPPTLESAYLPQERRNLVGQIASVLESAFDDGVERDRMRRFIAWWSSSGPVARTDRSAEGHLFFAGIHRAAYEAFGLQWLGDEGALIDAPSAVPGRPAEPAQNPRTRAAEPLPRRLHPRASPPPPEPPGPPPPPEQPRRARVNSGQMGELRAELPIWQAGGTVRDASLWSRLLMEILNTLPWRTLGVPYWLEQRLFTENTVVLEGTRQTDVRHFALPKERWVRDGLDAWLALSTPSEEDPEYSRRRLARFLRRLMQLVRERVVERSLRTSVGVRWNPAGTAAQALLARAWLQGRVDMTSPLASQWEAILEPDSGSAEVAASHTEGWKEVVNRVSLYRAPFQDMLRAWILFRSGKSDEYHGVVDAGAIAPALVAMANRLDPDLPPVATSLPEQVKIWESIADIGRSVRRVLPQLPRHELNRVKRALETIDLACDGRSLPQYLAEVEQVIAALRQQDSRAPFAVVQDWTRARQHLQSKGLLDGSPGGRLQRLEDFLAGADVAAIERIDQASAVEQLAWVIEAPTADLSLVAEQIEAAERTLGELWKYASTLLADANSEASDAPEALQAAGARLLASVDLIASAIPVEGT
jgi:hypothetical protein